MKRNIKNIGKMVRIKNNAEFQDCIGIVKGFRGDYEKRNPWVEVFLLRTSSIFPFKGSDLIPYRKEK